MRWNACLAFICAPNGSVTVREKACVFIPGTTELTLSWKCTFCLPENLEGRLSVFGVAVHKTGSVVIYPANSRTDLAPQSRSPACYLRQPRGADLSEVVYKGDLMTFSQDAPLINSNTCSRLNLVVYGKHQMPATGKCISKIQCVHSTVAAEGWRECMRATPLQCAVLREADTRCRDAQNADCQLLGAESWEEGIEERAHWGFHWRKWKCSGNGPWWQYTSLWITLTTTGLSLLNEQIVCCVHYALRKTLALAFLFTPDRGGH